MLFGLLGKLGEQDAINAAADSLGCHIYLLYRLLHRAAGGSTAYFALPEEELLQAPPPPRPLSARTDYARALAKLSREKAAFPDMSHETLDGTFPAGVGFVQVFSTADGQLNRLNQMDGNECTVSGLSGLFDRHGLRLPFAASETELWVLLAASLVFYLWNGTRHGLWGCGLLAVSSSSAILQPTLLRKRRREMSFLPPFAIMSRYWEFSSTPVFSPAAQYGCPLCRWVSAFSPFSRSGIFMRYTPGF